MSKLMGKCGVVLILLVCSTFSYSQNTIDSANYSWLDSYWFCYDQKSYFHDFQGQLKEVVEFDFKKPVNSVSIGYAGDFIWLVPIIILATLA